MEVVIVPSPWRWSHSLALSPVAVVFCGDKVIPIVRAGTWGVQPTVSVSIVAVVVSPVHLGAPLPVPVAVAATVAIPLVPAVVDAF